MPDLGPDSANLSVPRRRGSSHLVVALAICVTVFGAQPSRGQNAPSTAGGASTASSRDEQVRQLQQRPWEIRAARVRTAVRLDGFLDEEDWARAEVLSEFYQRLRRDVLRATERTEIRILYDDRFLYIGVRAFDSEPEKLIARSILRDEATGDAINIMIDAYHGHRSAIQIYSNANGVMGDMLQSGESETTRNINFDMVWDSKGRRTPTGYEVEMAIPFKSLRFPQRAPGEEIVFGIAFKRNVPRKNEEAIWPYVSNDSSWYRPAELGHLRGIRDVRHGRNLELRPYALGGANRDLRSGVAAGRREAGLDVKWGVTTGLMADFSLNTDFAQEEVDVQQTNFTRFSLFFPEKRQFFLEGQQLFQFGVAREADLTFTRRIGLSPAGEIVPIQAGARLSGRQGRTSLGAMNIQTGAAGALPGQNFSVVRVKRDIFSRSSVGGVVTNVEGGGRFNRVYGTDASLYFRRVWFLDGFLAGTNETGAPQSGAGYGRLAYGSDRIGAEYELLAIGERFNPGVGFVLRPDSRQHSALLRFSPRPPSDLIRQVHATGSLAYVTDQQNVLETRARKGIVQLDLETGHVLAVTATNQREFITAPFRLRSDLSIMPGVYDFNNVEASFRTPGRRDTSLNLTSATGGFWNGHRSTVSIRANNRMTTHFGVSLSYDINRVTLPAGAWTSQLVSSRVTVALRNDLSILSLLQYNRDTRQVSSNMRFNWIPKPGTNFFIVYNELDTDRPQFGPLNRSIAIKLNYLFAL